MSDLPDVEQARLHLLASEVWPAVGKLYGQIMRSVFSLPPDVSNDPSRTAELYRQLGPELELTDAEMVEAANYRVAIKDVEELRLIGDSPSRLSP